MNKCKSIARRRACKHIPATHKHATIGRLLLGNRAVKQRHQQYRLCFPLGLCGVYITIAVAVIRSKFSQEHGHKTAHRSSVEVEEELEVSRRRLNV
jgi:hypothetical protein